MHKQLQIKKGLFGWAATLFFILLLELSNHAQANLPELPRTEGIETCFPDTTNYRRVTVGPLGRDYNNLQQALDEAQPGTVLILDAGAEYRGSFILRAKPQDSRWIVLISSQIGLLPDEEERVHPLIPTGNPMFPNQKSAMPRIISTHSGGTPAIRTEIRARRYWLSGLEITVDTMVRQSFGLVNFGDASSTQNSLDKVPEWLCLDRCYLHGHNKGDIMKYGVRLDCANGLILGCHFSEFHSIGFDAQAISGINGPGPFMILNNHLEGAAENILFGGGTPVIAGLVPSDIVVKYNHLIKPYSWRMGHRDYAGIHWTIKNLFELKTGRRVLLEGNILEQCWADLPIGQSGYAILLTVRTENGTSAQADVSDITIRKNIIRNTGAGISISGSDGPNSIRSKRILIENNLMYGISGPLHGDGNIAGPNDGTAFHLGEPQDLTIRHNTILHTGPITWAYKTMSGFSFTDNLCHSFISAGGYQGIYGPGVQQVNNTFIRYFPDVTDASRRFHKNILIGGNASRYTNFNTQSLNYFPGNINAVGFVNYTEGPSNPLLFGLNDTSPFKNAASDGKDIGADIGDLLKSMDPVKNCSPLSQSDYPKDANIYPKLWPNPCFGRLTVKAETGFEIMLYDAMGVMRMHTLMKEDLAELNLQNLGTGLYFCHLRSGTSQFSIPLILL